MDQHHLSTLSTRLAAFLAEVLPSLSGRWWQTHVRDALTLQQRQARRGDVVRVKVLEVDKAGPHPAEHEGSGCAGLGAAPVQDRHAKGAAAPFAVLYLGTSGLAAWRSNVAPPGQRPWP